MATALTGKVDDQDIVQDRRVVDMNDVISYLDPNVSQFTTMLMKVASKTASNSKVEWLEDELFPRLSTLGANIADGTTTSVTVATGDGQFFRAGDLCRVATTGEAFRVSSVATDVLTVVRGIGAVSGASASSGAQVVIIGNVSQQGAGLGTRKVLKKVMNYNYTQIQRNPYGFVNTLIESNLYGGSEPDEERQKKLVEHKRSIENTLFWGARAYDTSGSEPIGYSGGVIEFLSTNVKNVAGTLTASGLDGYLKDFLQHGSENKVLFVAPVVAAAISGFARGTQSGTTYETDAKTRLWGAKVDGLLSGAYGYQIPVIVKRDWNDFATANTQYGGWAFMADMDYVRFRPFKNRNTKLLRDRQANDADGYDEEYMTEFTLEFRHERAHGLLKGITG